MAPQTCQRHAAIGVRLLKHGPERDRPVVARQRFLGALQLGQHEAAIGIRLRQVRPQRDRPVVARQRFGMAPQRAQPHAEIAKRRRIVAMQPQRLADQRHALLRPARLQREQPGQVQHVVVVRLPPQDVVIYRFGFGQHPALMQRTRALNVILQGVAHSLAHAGRPPARPLGQPSAASPSSVNSD